MLQHSGRYRRCVFVFCKRKRFRGLQKCLRFQNEYNKVEIELRVVQFWTEIKLVTNLVPRVFRKDPGIGWSRASSKIDRPRGCGESIKLQTVTVKT